MQWSRSLCPLIVSMFVAACAPPAAPSGETPAALEHRVERTTADHNEPANQPAPAPSALTRIPDHAGICMLSNRYLGERADVPIEVEGKTYRGCCANCAARLGSQPEARIATDPVTGKSVDKATAVLARDANNRVYYFESEATLASYAAR